MRAVDVGVDPLLAVVSPLLVEGEVDSLPILFVLPLEHQLVLLDVPEILLGLLGGAGAKTFVVLALPALTAVGLLMPLVVLIESEKALFVLALFFLALLPNLHDGCHKLLQEPVHLDQGRPPMVDQIDKQALDVRSIVVLVSHDHDRAVAKPANRVVFPLDVQAHDLEKVRNLRVTRDLLVVGVAHVQDLASQREDAITVATDDTEACNCQRLRRVSFRED
mmetsp:Transcript_34625/g.112675  ORF Transcript_34625/g.112675 Transcript_34625/m.112675 type:complete len:221 (-) Transcript_34625:1470-2132(-)